MLQKMFFMTCFTLEEELQDTRKGDINKLMCYVEKVTQFMKTLPLL